MMWKQHTVVIASTLLFAACSSQAGSSAKTPAPETRDVQLTAVAAAPTLTSSVVEASGRVVQGDRAIDLKLTYTAVGSDRIAYTDTSSSSTASATVSVIAVGPAAWSLEDGRWVALPSADLRTFSAERMWALVPFSGATLVGIEDVGGHSARHYRASTSIRLGLEEFAGSLIALDGVELSGEFKNADIDYWSDGEFGWPVKATYHVTGDGTLDLTARLTKSNDLTIQVDPPAD